MSWAMTLVGVYFYYKVTQLAAEVSLETGGQWTGVITIYVFLSQLLTFGFAIALALHVRKPSTQTMLILFVGLAFYLERILIHGRRMAMIELFLFFAMALWFNRRWAPPRWAVISGILIGVLVVNSIGDYRATMLEGDRTTYTGAGLREVLSIDYLGNLRNNFSEGGADIKNALYGIEAADQSFEFDYGLSFYNAVITRYVPAQIIGTDFKQSLLVDVGISESDLLGHAPNTGSTYTGLSDSFWSFWYFGAVKFFLIGFIFSRWFRAAVKGNLAAQIVAMILAYSALGSMPFSTHTFFLKFVDLIVFLLPVLWYARVGKSTPLNKLA